MLTGVKEYSWYYHEGEYSEIHKAQYSHEKGG